MNSQFNPVTHVIFDCDGLLLDTEDIYSSVDAEVIGRYGKDYPPSLRNKVLGVGEVNASLIIINDLKLPVTVEEYRTQADELLQKKLGDADLMPGVDELVRNLHRVGVPTAIATSARLDDFYLKTSKNRDFFDKYFSHVVAASSDSEVESGKPAPDVFLVCAKRFADSPSPSKCLVFEDAPNGVLGATRAGMQTVLVPAAYIPEEDRKLATLSIDSLCEFRPEWFHLPSFA